MLRGRSEPWRQRPEPTSGQPVHVLDLTALDTVGDGYRIVADGQRSHPFRVAADVYGEVSRDALRLFYLLRSGCAVDERRAPGYGRPAGHEGDAAVPGWPGYPGWRPAGVFDVSGGWYDAGDYGKYVVSGSIALWQLLDLLRLVRRHPGSTVSEVDLTGECRWQLDWLVRMQVPAGQSTPAWPFTGCTAAETAGVRTAMIGSPTTPTGRRPNCG